MVYKKIQDEQGDYKDNEEVRYTVLEANKAHTPEGLNVGWDEFENIDKALKTYNLTYDPFIEEVKE